jgi:hypothetical protein
MPLIPGRQSLLPTRSFSNPTDRPIWDFLALILLVPDEFESATNSIA